MMPSYALYANIILSALCFIVFINNIIFYAYNEKINYYSAWLVLLISVYFMYRCRKNILLFIMSFFIFYSNYSISVGIYVSPNRPSVLYSQITDVATYGIGITLILLFMWLLVMFMPQNIKTTNREYNPNILEKNINILIISFLCIVLSFIFVYGYSRTSLIRGSSSPIYEYSVILFILGFHYSGNNKYLQAIMKILLVLFALQSFMNGTRVEGFIFIISFICYFYAHKITYLKLIPILMIGIFFMIYIGVFRANATLSLENIAFVLSTIKDSKFVFDTATWAYFPSLCMIEVRNIIPFSESLRLFKQFVLSIFLGGSVADSNPTDFVRQYYWHANGGWSQMFFYFWFGWIGMVPLLSLVIFYMKAIINRFPENSKGSYRQLLAIYIVSTVPRWYIYAPLPLLRGAMLFSIAYLGLYLVNKIKIRK